MLNSSPLNVNWLPTSGKTLVSMVVQKDTPVSCWSANTIRVDAEGNEGPRTTVNVASSMMLHVAYTDGVNRS